MAVHRAHDHQCAGQHADRGPERPRADETLGRRGTGPSGPARRSATAITSSTASSACRATQSVPHRVSSSRSGLVPGSHPSRMSAWKKREAAERAGARAAPRCQAEHSPPRRPTEGRGTFGRPAEHQHGHYESPDQAGDEGEVDPAHGHRHPRGSSRGAATGARDPAVPGPARSVCRPRLVCPSAEAAVQIVLKTPGGSFGSATISAARPLGSTRARTPGTGCPSRSSTSAPLLLATIGSLKVRRTSRGTADNTRRRWGPTARARHACPRVPAPPHQPPRPQPGQWRR